MSARRVIGGALAALLIGPLGLLVAAPSAHATNLIASTPNAGAILSDAISAISLTADVPLLDQGSEITVTDPAGNRVDDGSLTIDTTTATVGLKALTRSGMYKVTYTLVADGDVPASGSYSFMFNAPSAISSATPTPTPTATKNSSNSSSNSGGNLLVYIMLILALGVSVFLFLYIRAIIADVRKAQKKSKKSAPRARAKKTDE